MTYKYEFKDFGKIRNILYVGDDNNFWGQIKKEYDKHFSHINFLFYLYKIEGDINYKDVFLKTLQLKPAVVYLDFTKKHDQMFSLSRLLGREGNFFGTPIVGLVNDLDEIDEAIKNGCNFIYVKCGEMFDTVYGPLRYCMPATTQPPKFAKAFLDEKREIFVPLRIGYFHPSRIHLEGNFIPLENKEYTIETHIPKKILPSKIYTNVKNEIENGTYYQHNSAFSMEYQYVNKPNLLKEIEKAQQLKQKVDASPQLINATIQEYTAERSFIQKNFSKWVKESIGEDSEKLVRILIVDESYDVLSQYEGDLSDTKYSFRLQSSSAYSTDDIIYIRPDLICFSLMDEPSIEEARKIIFEHKKKKGLANKYQKKSIYSDDPLDDEDDDDDLNVDTGETEDEEAQRKMLVDKIINEELKGIFSSYDSIPNYDPVIVIFNCRKDTEEISLVYGVEKLITIPSVFSYELVSKMVEKIEANKKARRLAEMEEKLQKLKQEKPTRYKNVNAADLRESKLYLNKHDQNSTARLKLEITLLAFSESEVWFTSNEKLNFGIYEFDIPTKIKVTLAPDPETYQQFTAEKEGNIYHGLIHSFDENGKKLLRQEVNRIFFSDLTAERELEEKEYKDMTKQALDKKLQELEKLKKLMELNDIKKKI